MFETRVIDYSPVSMPQIISCGELLSKDEIESLMRDTDDLSRARALLDLREALMFDRQEDIAEIRGRHQGAAYQRLVTIICEAAGRGRTVVAINTLNLALATAFWRSDERFVAWDEFLDRVRRWARYGRPAPDG